MPRRGRIIVAMLAVLSITSLWRAVSVEHDRRRLATAYTESQDTVKRLSEEREHLTDQMTSASHVIEEQVGSMASLQAELERTQDRFQVASAELAQLQQEYATLRDRDTSLTAQLDEAVNEQQQLEAKLSSLHDLRLALRDVKRKIWQQRWAAWRARLDALKVARSEESDQVIAGGNRGYVVRDGRPTLGVRPTLHVHVLEPQSQ